MEVYGSRCSRSRSRLELFCSFSPEGLPALLARPLLKMVPELQSHRDNVSADLCIHFVGGGLAGITATTSTYPLDLVRTCLTAQANITYYRGIWLALQTVSKEEGIFGLYIRDLELHS